MKVKLNKDLIKEYGFHVGGDLSETICIALDKDGNPIKYKDVNEKCCFTMTVQAMDLATDSEFLVVDHDDPISERQYEVFKKIYVEVE